MDLSRIYPKRPAWVHKGNYGNLLVVCGSKLYSGAATLAASAGLRAGADLVTVCAPKRAADVASFAQASLMSFPLAGDYLSSKHVNDILDTAHLRRINCVVLGCGLGRHWATEQAIYKLIAKFTVPMVLDADALRAIAKRPESVYAKQAVLTPHLGELAILLGQSKVSDDIEARMVAAKQVANKYHCVVVVKGHVDVICDGESTITNSSGSPFMTKGGFGDTLSGICGALIARGVGVFEAAHAACYINGKAGEEAAVKRGEGLVASDIFDFIPKAITDY